MMSPTRINKNFLSIYQERGRESILISGSNLHPSKTHYKYYWWIYDINSVYESAKEVFFKNEHQMSTKEFMQNSKKLRDEKKAFAYVNKKLYRLGSTWDYQKIKEEFPKIEFAPSYSDDIDEDWKGFK